MRDRLKGLLNNTFEAQYEMRGLLTAEHTADYLIANGVIASPCKVGDITYLLLEKNNSDYDMIESKCVSIFENEKIKSYSMWFDCKAIGNTLEFYPEDFGKTVFLNREDAEKALEGKI